MNSEVVKPLYPVTMY